MGQRTNGSIGAAVLLVAAAAAAGCRQQAKEKETLLGCVVGLPVGSFLAGDFASAPNRITRGSPALVLETGAGAVRVLAADGTEGWTKASAVRAVPVQIEGHVSALDTSPDEAAAANEVNLKPPVRIVGASRNSAVASMEQNMFPSERNWFNVPWLKLSGGPATGWAAPSTLAFSWERSLEPRGLVRPPFTGWFAGLNRLAPQRGTRIWRVDAAGGSAAWSVIEGEQFPTVWAIQTGSGDPAAILFASENKRLLRLSTGSLFFETYLPELESAECTGGTAGGKPVCYAEVTQMTGDGPFSTLWIVTPERASAVALQAAGGEPGGMQVAGRWWIERETGRVWIVRAEVGKNIASIVDTHQVEKPVQAIAAILPAQDTFQDAVASNIRIAGNALQILPLALEGKLKWAPGRTFFSRGEATTWIGTAPYRGSLTEISLP
jgi:hypothetical protein